MSGIEKGSKPTSLTHVPSSVSVDKSTPFANKILPSGKRVFKRVHGVKATVEDAQKNIELIIPYDFCKITGIELIAGNYGDKVNFKVYDTPTGTISTIPNYMLNQFGFDVYLAQDRHKEESNYDADLIKDMKLVVEYIPVNTGSPREVYVNFMLHELKS